MSTYSKQTKHPITGEWHNATWTDDYFGSHHYGVKFPNGDVFDPEKTKLETRDSEPMTHTEKRFIEIENQSSGECEELECGDEYIESQVISLTRKIHPQDLGEETSKLENILRQALEEVVAEERERVVGGDKPID